MAKAVLLVCALVLLAMAHLIPNPASAITCADVGVALQTCVPYLIGLAPDPDQACCNGARHIKDLCPTTPDRQAACSCMKDVASRLPGIKDAAVAALPAKCNAPLPYPISTSVDCTKIQ